MTEAIGDLQSVLVQAVHVDDDGATSLRRPYRATGVYGHETSQIATPIRVAEECALLAAASSPTIADTSFWSILMEVNQAITLKHHHQSEHLRYAIDRLIGDQCFLDTISNGHVIAMSKHGEASTLCAGVSDREAWGRILEPGEYTWARPLIEATTGRFGIEQREFTEAERKQVQAIYSNELGVLYFKPHTWSRAYRVEGHLTVLRDPDQLGPILAAIAFHTAARTIEPVPQMMADYIAKQIAHVARLYGQSNYHRAPFDFIRTGDPL